MAREFHRVEPAEGRIPDRPIIEVEAVYVDMGFNLLPSPERARATPRGGP